jgi:hypothetical protein
LSGRRRPTRRGGIVVVTDRRFWRRSIGSEQRIASLVLHLAQRSEAVTVAYLGRISRRERVRLARLLEASPQLEILPRRPTAQALAHGLRQFASEALGRFRPTRRPSIENPGLTTPSSPARRAFVDSVIRQRAPRVVIIEFLRLSYTLFPRTDTGTPRPLALVDTHDILHRRAERARARGASVAQPIEAAQELRMLADYDAVIAIQGLEAELLRTGLPGKSVLVVPHGLAMPPASGAPIGASRPIRIGFLGGRDESNLDALDWFVHEVWPGIHRRFASAVELHVAGQVTLRWTRAAEGLRILGRVDSVDDFWRGIDIAINPVRYGSGLKIKNVEALAYGRPLLTTSIGAEGLEAAAPDGLRVADSALEWTNALGEWLADPALADRVGRRGRAFAETRLCEAAAFAELDAYLDAYLDAEVDGAPDVAGGPTPLARVRPGAST